MDIIRYDISQEKNWDNFIYNESINGTVLQTRSFLNYHPTGRFDDYSLLCMKGNNIVAVIPGNCVVTEGKRTFISHQGSTYGGIIIGKQYKKIADMEQILDLFENHLIQNGFQKVILKQCSELYSKDELEMLYYMLFTRGFISSLEVGYYLPLSDIVENEIEQKFNASRRRGYRNSLKNQLEFRELVNTGEIREFYNVLENNMMKFDTKPVHTYDELIDLLKNRIPDSLRFFGVYHAGKIVAGSMVFDFNHKVFHTQYLATDQEMLHLYPSENLYYSLIKQAKKEQYQYISFGTSTLEHGRILNKSLAQFKEGFGTKQYVNYTFEKNIEYSGTNRT